MSKDLNYILDNDRKIAEKLEFFFYPTTFVLDKDMKVVERKPFQYETAKLAIAKTLGVESKEAQVPAKNPGAG